MASIVVDESVVGFPHVTSHGASGLHAQHLLDVVSGHTAPSAELCLNILTRLMNFLLSGRAYSLLPLCFLLGCVVPHWQLFKMKNGGVCPIAIGKILHCLASSLCCQCACPFLFVFFLPYGQLGVSIPGGLEAAIHAVCHLLFQFGSNEFLALCKLGMKNASSKGICSKLFVKSFQIFPLSVLVLQSAY